MPTLLGKLLQNLPSSQQSRMPRSPSLGALVTQVSLFHSTYHMPCSIVDLPIRFSFVAYHLKPYIPRLSIRTSVTCTTLNYRYRKKRQCWPTWLSSWSTIGITVIRTPKPAQPVGYFYYISGWALDPGINILRTAQILKLVADLCSSNSLAPHSVPSTLISH